MVELPPNLSSKFREVPFLCKWLEKFAQTLYFYLFSFSPVHKHGCCPLKNIKPKIQMLLVLSNKHKSREE